MLWHDSFPVRVGERKTMKDSAPFFPSRDCRAPRLFAILEFSGLRPSSPNGVTSRIAGVSRVGK